MNLTNPYDAKAPQRWLQDAHDYLAGRFSELDQLFFWIESQSEPIVDFDTVPSCVDCAEKSEISRQLWAFLGPLIRQDTDVKRRFDNVARHNGFEAWRRIAEPINEDKALRRKELLPL